MAWTAPRTWTNGSVVTDTQLNTDIRDNLNYLKNAPTFDGSPTVTGSLTVSTGLNVGTASGAGTGQVKAKGYTSFESLSAESAYTGGTFLQLNNTSSSARDYWIGSTGSGSGAGVGKLVFYDSTASAFRGAMNSSGNFGFGTTSPEGRIHAVGASGGAIFLSASAVGNTLQTLTGNFITAGAIFWLHDRNNTGGANVLGLSGQVLALGASQAYTNTDTITVAVTAGGAITVQRTAGSNGTHDIQMWVLYR